MGKWDYAELSRKAKEAGGVNELIRVLIESGRQKGRREMIPFVVISAVSGAGMTYLCMKANQFFCKENQITEQERKQAEEKLTEKLTRNEEPEYTDESNTAERDDQDGKEEQKGKSE